MPEQKHLTAADLTPKDRAKVLKVSAGTVLRKKFLAMGILPGVIVEMIRHAPLGDPIALKIKGYHLSIRKSEAKHILVEKVK